MAWTECSSFAYHRITFPSKIVPQLCYLHELALAIVSTVCLEKEGASFANRSAAHGFRSGIMGVGLCHCVSDRQEFLKGCPVSAGMVASVFIFVFSLPSFLWSYQPSFISGLAFFVIAAIGALSVISGFLLALYGAGATAVYSIATMSPNVRIGAGPRRRASNLRYHYD